MNCGFDYCIYNKLCTCLLECIEIDELGACRACVMVSIPIDELESRKEEQRRELESK